VLLPFIILGLTSGSVYALGAVGLVLTYKTSRIFNFSYGAIATTGAFVFYALHVQHGVSWPIAAAISVIGVGVVLGFVFEPFARALGRVNLALQVAATVGVLLFVQAFFTVIYGQDERLFPTFLPTGTFKVGGAYVQYSQLIIVIIALVATTALYLLLRFARIGVSMRAVVDDSSLLDLAGTSPTRVRRIAWIIGCTFASASGLLLAPSLSLSASTLTLLIVEAFGAAAIGAFASLPMTYVGGLLVGLVAALISKYTLTSSSILLGIPPSTPFIVLFAVLLLLPKRLLAARVRVIPQRPTWRAPLRVQAPAGLVVLILLAVVPSIVGVKLTAWTVGLSYVILFLARPSGPNLRAGVAQSPQLRRRGRRGFLPSDHGSRHSVATGLVDRQLRCSSRRAPAGRAGDPVRRDLPCAGDVRLWTGLATDLLRQQCADVRRQWRRRTQTWSELA
jgi:branched-subunit amino acid ABC-type transport system permease component